MNFVNSSRSLSLGLQRVGFLNWEDLFTPFLLPNSSFPLVSKLKRHSKEEDHVSRCAAHPHTSHLLPQHPRLPLGWDPAPVNDLLISDSSPSKSRAQGCLFIVAPPCQVHGHLAHCKLHQDFTWGWGLSHLHSKHQPVGLLRCYRVAVAGTGPMLDSAVWRRTQPFYLAGTSGRGCWWGERGLIDCSFV